jgi:hypothetical protein
MSTSRLRLETIRKGEKEEMKTMNKEPVPRQACRGFGRALTSTGSVSLAISSGIANLHPEQC